MFLSRTKSPFKLGFFVAVKNAPQIERLAQGIAPQFYSRPNARRRVFQLVENAAFLRFGKSIIDKTWQISLLYNQKLVKLYRLIRVKLLPIFQASPTPELRRDILP